MLHIKLKFCQKSQIFFSIILAHPSLLFCFLSINHSSLGQLINKSHFQSQLKDHLNRCSIRSIQKLCDLLFSLHIHYFQTLCSIIATYIIFYFDVCLKELVRFYPIIISQTYISSSYYFADSLRIQTMKDNNRPLLDYHLNCK